MTSMDRLRAFFCRPQGDNERVTAAIARAINELTRTGWRVLVVWECVIRNKKSLERKLMRFLEKE